MIYNDVNSPLSTSTKMTHPLSRYLPSHVFPSKIWKTSVSCHNYCEHSKTAKTTKYWSIYLVSAVPIILDIVAVPNTTGGAFILCTSSYLHPSINISLPSNVVRLEQEKETLDSHGWMLFLMNAPVVSVVQTRIEYSSNNNTNNHNGWYEYKLHDYIFILRFSWDGFVVLLRVILITVGRERKRKRLKFVRRKRVPTRIASEYEQPALSKTKWRSMESASPWCRGFCLLLYLVMELKRGAYVGSSLIDSDYSAYVGVSLLLESEGSWLNLSIIAPTHEYYN